MTPLILVITFSFFVLAFFKFKLAAQILIAILPSYLIRFKLFGLPSTFLEASFGVVFLAWLLHYARQDLPRLIAITRKEKVFAAFFTLFFIGSFISIFISDMRWYSLGQWRAYFLEPMLLFIVLAGRREMFSAREIILPLGVSTLTVSVFGLFQSLTGFTLPADGRSTSIYTSPNAVGLYLAPIMMLVILFLNKLNKRLLAAGGIVFACALGALVFTRSLGTFLGLGAASFLLLILFYKKQLAALVLGLAIVTALFVPGVRSFISSKDRSSGNRFTLWTYSLEYLTASPKNFIFGTGVRQFFRKIQKPEYDPKQMERLIYPHNIFLNFWTETGLLGVIGFTGIFSCLWFFSVKVFKNNKLLGAVFLAALTTILVHGLVDVPYFKNDLSMMFWVVAALIVNEKKRLV